MPVFYPKLIKEGYGTYVICPISNKKIKHFNNAYAYDYSLRTNDFIGKSCRGSADPSSDRNCPYHKSRRGNESIKCDIPAEELERTSFADDGTGQFQIVL